MPALDPLPPTAADDCGGDVDQRLLSRCRFALEAMAAWGLDWTTAYSDLIAAMDAKEWAIIEAAKNHTTNEGKASW